MKAAFLFLLLTSPALAQNSPSQPAVASGCGAANARFDVKNVKGQDAPTQPEAGKALVYFIQDDSEYAGLFAPTTRAGVDGAWVGATHGNSYFAFSVAPGEHHLCASLQTSEGANPSSARALVHFTAEAGNVYYFRVKTKWHRDYANTVIDFTPVDSDEGMLLASTFSLKTSRPRN
jgi:hypothetical protein